MKPEEIFKEHKSLKEYHETSDGNKFYDPLIANTHAKTLKDKTVKPFFRKDYEGKKNEVVKLTSDQKIENIKSLTTIEAVEAALENEKTKKVLAAGAEKIEELNKSDNGITEDQEVGKIEKLNEGSNETTEDQGTE